jgi:hypothetical protein
VPDGEITVRHGPTYTNDLKRLNLSGENLKAVTGAIDEILKALSENPNKIQIKHVREIHSRETNIAIGSDVSDYLDRT